MKFVNRIGLDQSNLLDHGQADFTCGLGRGLELLVGFKDGLGSSEVAKEINIYGVGSGFLFNIITLFYLFIFFSIKILPNLQIDKSHCKIINLP